MTFFEKRRARKELKDILHHAKHVRHMHEDIVDPELIERLLVAEKAARKTYKRGDQALMETAGRAVESLCEQVAPPRPQRKIRENVEVVFVAIAAAMAIRAYFFQPFKIPTGSMQPTLYGITMQENPTLPMNNLLFKVLNAVLFGETQQKVITAKTSGEIQMGVDRYGVTRPYFQPNADHTLTIYIGRVGHKIPAKLYYDGLLRIGETIRAGEPIARSAVRKSGDYILVNRIKYNFIPPKRGDIAVFDTRDMTHPKVRDNAYYIKRMVGLPGETISLNPPYLLVDGKQPADPRFDKLFYNDDYSGYVFGQTSFDPNDPAPLIGKSGDSITLADNEYLFFGDNTVMSLDGRYFGAVKEKRILGPAFFVCWPLDRAGFAEIWH
jgi:signal peptidase I